jgi:hypothetical protein
MFLGAVPWLDGGIYDMTTRSTRLHTIVYRNCLVVNASRLLSFALYIAAAREFCIQKNLGENVAKGFQARWLN